MIDYDPFSPEALHHPLPLYRRLRYEAPCYFIASRNTWAISRFEDVWRESAQTDCYTSALGTLSTQVMSDRQRPLPPTLHCADAPQHTALWRALAKHMGAIALRGHEVHIQGVVDELVDAAYERGRFDMIDDVAWPLAVKVLALVCGFPIEDAALLHEFTRRYQTREPGLIGPTTDAIAAVSDSVAYLVELIRARRAAGFTGDSLIDTMGRLEIDGKILGEDASLATHLSNFLLGGSTVFPKGFGTVAYRLFTHPDQRQDVARSPDLALPAFLEALRMDTPIQMRGRVVTKERELHGQTMLPGHGVMFLYASAGRDEREFPNPDHFDIYR